MARIQSTANGTPNLVDRSQLSHSTLGLLEQAGAFQSYRSLISQGGQQHLISLNQGMLARAGCDHHACHLPSCNNGNSHHRPDRNGPPHQIGCLLSIGEHQGHGRFYHMSHRTFAWAKMQPTQRDLLDPVASHSREFAFHQARLKDNPHLTL